MKTKFLKKLVLVFGFWFGIVSIGIGATQPAQNTIPPINSFQNQLNTDPLDNDTKETTSEIVATSAIVASCGIGAVFSLAVYTAKQFWNNDSLTLEDGAGAAVLGCAVSVAWTFAGAAVATHSAIIAAGLHLKAQSFVAFLNGWLGTALSVNVSNISGAAIAQFTQTAISDALSNVVTNITNAENFEFADIAEYIEDDFNSSPIVTNLNNLANQFNSEVEESLQFEVVAVDDPEPVITNVSISPAQAAVGEQITIAVTVRNDGGFSNEGGISISIPLLNQSGDTSYVSDATTHSNDSFPSFYPKGKTIYHRDGTTFTSGYMLAEFVDTNFAPNEEKTFRIRITKPDRSGDFKALVRSTMRSSVDSNVWINTPNTSNTQDQQGWDADSYFLVATSIDIQNAELSDSSVEPGDSITVSGQVNYNTGSPVISGEVIINSGGTVYTANITNGQFSRDNISAPNSSGNISLTASGGGFTDTDSLYVAIDGDSSGSNDYDAYYHMIAVDTYENNGSNTLPTYGYWPGGYQFITTDPSIANNYKHNGDGFYKTDDETAGVSIYLEDLDINSSIAIKYKFYSPDGTHYGTLLTGPDDDDCSGIPSGQYTQAYTGWCGYDIDGADMAENPGRYKVKIYFDEGNGFERKKTLYFTVGWNLTEHRMGKGIDSNHDLISQTNKFYQDDGSATFWVESIDVSQAIDVKWEFYEPNGALYFEFDHTTDDPNDDGDGNDHVDYNTAGWIDINGSSAQDKTGLWSVKYYVKNPVTNVYQEEYTDSFQILENPNRKPTIANISISDSNPVKGDSLNISADIEDNTYLKKVVLHWRFGNQAEQTKTWDNLNTDSHDIDYTITNNAPVSNLQYWIEAYDNSDNVDNSVTYISIITPTPPNTPTVSDGDYTDKVLISWSSVSDANSYIIYRCTSTSTSSSSCSEIGTDSTLSYDDTEATAGIIYYYRLKACSSGSGTVICSDYSNYDSGYRAIVAPNTYASDGDGDKVRILWSSVSGANSYIIYRSTNSGGVYSKIATYSAPPYVHYDTPPTIGKTYYYRLKACSGSDETGICSDYSDYDSGYRAIVAPSPSASDGTHTDKVSISWSSASGANNYIIYRCTNINSNSCPEIGTDSTSPYDDTGVTAGIIYYYRLKACSGSSGRGNCSIYSSYNQGHRAITDAPSIAFSPATITAFVRASIGNITVINIGGVVASYSIAPAITNNLSFNTNTGTISGIPSAIASETTYTVIATNSFGSSTATLSIEVKSFSLDVDGNGTINASNDGLIIFKYLLNSNANNLHTTIANDAARKTTAQLKAYLDDARAILDADGNGPLSASSDGLIIFKYLLNSNANNLHTTIANDAINSRKTTTNLKAYLDKFR